MKGLLDGAPRSYVLEVQALMHSITEWAKPKQRPLDVFFIWPDAFVVGTISAIPDEWIVSDDARELVAFARGGPDLRLEALRGQ